MLRLISITCFLWDNHPRNFSKLLNRLNETQSLVFHQKANGGAVGTTTKAVIKLFSRAYCKRGGFFIMKRAASRIIRPCFFERNAFVNHVINIDAINKFLDKAFWNHILRLIVSKSLRAKAWKFHLINIITHCQTKQKRSLQLLFSSLNLLLTL